MAGPLSSQRPASGANLTGGPDTSTWKEANQDFNQVKRTAYQERPARTGTFSLSNGAATRPLNQKSTGMLNNLRGSSGVFKKRLRK